MARLLKKNDQKPATLVRVAKFEIKPDTEQTISLSRVSDNLWYIWNTCRQERVNYFELHQKPLFERFKDADDVTKKNLKEAIKATYNNAPMNYVHGAPERSQRNWLTQMRQAQSDFASIPCAWQQETLVILEGAYDSFYQLRKNGDTTARPPREKAADSFCEIQGLRGWQIIADGYKINPQKLLSQNDQAAIASAESVEILLSPGKALWQGPELRFKIPQYQQLLLCEAVKLNKFTLYRESKRGKSYRYWISLAYAVPKPATTEVQDREKIFLVLGSTSIGVSTPMQSFTINLWRSDKYWMPKIETLRSRLKKCVRGSLAWKRRTEAVNRMYEMMRQQTLQHHREVIATQLRCCGAHFVIMAQSPIRGKPGALADGNNPSRGGTLGANWSVQNTGSLAQLRQLLEQKVVEWGGSVEIVKLKNFPKLEPRAARRQIAAEQLRLQVCS